MVVVSIIVLLALIGTLAYNGIQDRAKRTLIFNDLSHATTTVEQYGLKNKGKFPDAAYIDANLDTSEGIVMSVTTSEAPPVYIGLTPVQNGALFFTVCKDLVAEGYGVGTNNGGQEEKYISGCNVYNYNQLQVNSAWNGRNFNTPVAATALPNVVSSINYNDSWRPNRTQIEKEFYQTWHDRFITQGGTYPITSFWDGNWCSPGQAWCKPFEPLSEPVVLSANNAFCVAAAHSQLRGQVYHITSYSNTPKPGDCS